MLSVENARGKTSLQGLLVGLTFCLFAVLLVIYGARQWFPPVASQHAPQVDYLMRYLLLATGGMLLIGHLVFGYFIWNFSRQRQVTQRLVQPRSERRWSIGLGILVAVVGEGGVLALGLPLWDQFYGTEAPADAVHLEVTAEQFNWNIRYPGQDGVFGRVAPELLSLNNPVGLDADDPAARDDLLLLGEFFLPVNRPVTIRLRSKDVLHSFYLPHFRVKQDAVPGMSIDIWFVPTKEGNYELACAELCGFGHYKMRGLLHVVGEEEYEQFLDEELPFLY
ncbi:cytochrome-c oxidase [Acidobacteria bacterium AH-259-D05]|nr:cytochrome-c oxidase [Acidobacteria bacterium AH-259-D05]